MKDLLVPAVIDKPSDENKPENNVVQEKDEQLNADVTEGSSIKVSISQDSLLTKSPQRKQPQQMSEKKPNTAAPTSRSHTTEGLSSITEKYIPLEKKESRKGSRLAQRFHR